MTEINKEKDGESPIDPELVYNHLKYSHGDRIITMMYADRENEEAHVLFRGAEAGMYTPPTTGDPINFQYSFFIEADNLTEAFEKYNQIAEEKLEKHIENIDAQVKMEMNKAAEAQNRIQTDPRWKSMMDQLPPPGKR